MKVLLIRMDRLGDIVVSLPAFEAIDADVWVMVPIAYEQLVNQKKILWDSKLSFWALIRKIREVKFDAVAILQGSLKIHFAIWLARIPYRVGRKDKWYTFLFLNHGIRQRRSQGNRHELEWSLDLLKDFPFKKNVMTIPQLPIVSKKWGRNWFLSRHIDTRKPLVVIHPGMGGSALNWPVEFYATCIEQVSQFANVCVTSGVADQKNTQKVFERLQNPSQVLLYQASSEDGIEKLQQIILCATVFFAPSTGPLHLAAALGIPVVSVFPPLKVQSAQRWSPLGKNVKVLSVNVLCPGSIRCLQAKCIHFDCMRMISVQSVTGAIRDFCTKSANSFGFI